MFNTDSQTTVLIEQAIAKQLLPNDASLTGDKRQTPLPIMLLTTLGVWLAAFPLVIGFLWLLYEIFGHHFFDNAALLLVLGSAILAASTYVLRTNNIAMFLEQFAFSALLTGGIMFSIGLFQGVGLNDLDAIYFVTLSMLTTGFAYLIPIKWIRVVLGAIAAALIWFAWNASVNWQYYMHNAETQLPPLLMASSYLLVLWAICLYLQYKAMDHKLSLTIAIEPFATGWITVGLITLAVEAGRTFLIGGSHYFIGPATFGLQSASIVGVLFAVAGCWFIGKRWLQLQRLPLMVVALLLCVLVWFMPGLGGAILVLAIALSSQRYHIALFAALIALWVIGAFYYQLHWSLSSKALLLILVAIGLGVLAWFQHKYTLASDTQRHFERAISQEAGFNPHHLLLVCGFLVLLVANIGIWQKEDIIANGKPVFVKLAPVDPRSLMQGDYMALNYVLPAVPNHLRDHQVLYGVAEHQAFGDTKIKRIVGPEATLAAGEFLIQLKHMPRGWTVVSNAWYFKEGTGKRWENAAYGEFRVKPDGRALLVGLADAHLKPLAKSE